MSTSVPSVADIIASFPEPVSKISGPPTYPKLKTLRQTLKANAASIECTLGGGQHGYLGLILTPAQYNRIVPPAEVEGEAQPPNSWIDPDAPPTHPDIPANATQHIARDRQAAHTEAKRVFQEYRNVHNAFKQTILNNIDSIYLSSLRDPHVGYANQHARDILAHLFNTYGKITSIDLEENHKRFTNAWDANDPLEALINQITDAVEFADDAKTPYSDTQILNNAFNLVYKTGLYNEPCQRWMEKPTADRTWDNFKSFFLKAQEQLRLQRTTQRQTGFGAMAHESTFLAATDTLRNLINQVSHDQASLQSQVSALTNHSPPSLANASTESTLLTKLDNLVTEVNNIKAQLDNNKPKRNRRNNTPKDNGSYCWTHGFLVHKDHNSHTCKNKAAGHKDEATRTNTMGGNQTGKPTM